MYDCSASCAAAGEIAATNSAAAARRETMDFMVFPREVIEPAHRLPIGEGPPLDAAAHPTRLA
jgi:hypothetical protein